MKPVAAPLFALCLVSSLGAAADPEPLHPNSQLPGSSNTPPAWDRQAAAKHLDDRMDLWFVKARKLQTGEGKTSCVSCHITVPYVLARPALRQATDVGQPAPQESKLFDETLHRVDTYGHHEALSAGKDEQSRGSEVVLNVLILASAEARQNEPLPGGATRRALNELMTEDKERTRGSSAGVGARLTKHGGVKFSVAMIYI